MKAKEESYDKLLHTSLGRELTPSTRKQDKTRHREPPTSHYYTLQSQLES